MIVTAIQRKYLRYLKNRNYSFLLNDGSLLQCFYTFHQDQLISQDFCFFRKVIADLEDDYYSGTEDNQNEDKQILSSSESGKYPIFHFDYDPKYSTSCHSFHYRK